MIENLNSRVELINNQSLEQLDSRLQMIVQRVNQLNDKKTVIEDQEKLQRVNELYSMIVRWKDFSAAIPTIVERLNALNELHEKGKKMTSTRNLMQSYLYFYLLTKFCLILEAFQFASILTRLDADQQAMKEKLGINSEVLSNVSKMLLNASFF